MKSLLVVCAILCAASSGAFEVRMENYSAQVSADGSLSVRSGEDVLVKSLWVLCNTDRLAMRATSEAGDRTVVIREEKAPADGKAPGLKLTFREGAIDVVPLGVPKLDAKGNTPFAAYFGLGDDAVGVSNIVLNVEDALPTTRFAEGHIFSFYEHVGNCWPDVAILGADGATLTLRGITGVRPVRDFHIFPQELDAATPKGVAVMPLAAERPFTIEIAAAPSGARPRAAVPACTVKPLHSYALYPVREPARFSLKFPPDAPVGKYRLEWTMVDHVQRPLGTGSAVFELGKGDAPNEALVDIVPADADPGYVYAQAWLSRVGEPSARRYLTFEFGRCKFERDILDRRPPWDVNGEVYLMNLLGFRGLRLYASISGVWLDHKDPNDPERIDWEAWKAKWREILAYCEKGTVKCIMMLMEGPGKDQMDAFFKEKYGAATDKRDAVLARWYREFGAAAQEVGLLWWEPWNEPDIQMPHEKYINEILKPIYDDFKAGGPKINFLGGSCCGLDKAPWVSRLYELDENGRHFDGISFHPYTGVGFQRIYRMYLAQWQRLYPDHNDDPAQGVFITEGANHRGWGFNDFAYDCLRGRRESHAHTGLHMMLHAEAFGIPRQRFYVFYACQHGYNDFYLVRFESPTPSAIAFQVMNAALGEAKFEKEVPLPGHDHYFQRFRGDDRTVAALFTAGDTIKVRVATDAACLTLTDCMGVARALKPVDGVVEVSVDNFPVFLSAPVGARLDPVYDGLQVRRNLALNAIGAKASAAVAKDPGSPEIGAILAGDWTGYINGCWNESPEGAGPDGSGVFPDTFEITLPSGSPPIGSVTVYHNYGAWERTLRDYDVDVFTDGKWRTVASLRGNFYAEVTTHDFAPVTAERVRIVVTGVNRCTFGTVDWIKAQTSLRAVEVHAAAERPARAFFADGVLASPVADKDGKAELEYRLVNATGSEVSGELRFMLPGGMSASPVAVSIPANGETTVRAVLSVGGKGACGTVVAALYDAEGRMISSDVDVRTVKAAP